MPWLDTAYTQATGGKSAAEKYPDYEPCHRIYMQSGVCTVENAGGDIDEVTGRRMTIEAPNGASGLSRTASLKNVFPDPISFDSAPVLSSPLTGEVARRAGGSAGKGRGPCGPSRPSRASGGVLSARAESTQRHAQGDGPGWSAGPKVGRAP